MVPLSWSLVLAALLFSLGIYGVLARANAIGILMALELMLNGVILNIVAFWRYGAPTQVRGQMFAILVFVVAAAEAAVGLALIISIYRRRGTVVAEDVSLLKW